MLVDIIGFIAATLTTSAFLPQAIKTWKSRSTEDLSPLMFALFCFGVGAWLVYGIFKTDWPIILANCITLVLAGSIMFFILKKHKTNKIVHIGLYVNDLEEAKEFYQIYFSGTSNTKYTNRNKNFSSYFIQFSSGMQLEIMHVASEIPAAIELKRGHIAFGFQSRKEVIQLTQKLRNSGFDIISEPRQTGDGYYESVVSDPSGNLIELTTLAS